MTRRSHRYAIRTALAMLLVAAGIICAGPAWSQDGSEASGSPDAGLAGLATVSGSPATAGSAAMAGSTTAGSTMTAGQALEESLHFSAGGMLARVGLGLLLVFSILGSVLFLYKKATRGSLGGGTRHGIEVVTQRGIGQKSSLAVVRVAGETLLLGITPNQIRLLTPIGEASSSTSTSTNSCTNASAVSVTGHPASTVSNAPFQARREAARSNAPAQVPAGPAGPGGPNPVAASLALDGGTESLFENELAGEVRRVRENLVTSLSRLNTAER